VCICIKGYRLDLESRFFYQKDGTHIIYIVFGIFLEVNHKKYVEYIIIVIL